MSLKPKSLHGLTAVITGAINDFDTKIRKWATDSFALKSHNHSTNTVLFAPDFSRRILMYKSEDDPNGKGFRIHNPTNTTTEYNARIFQLKYPCFIYTEITTFSAIDTDMVLEMCRNKENVIAHIHHEDNNTNRYLAAIYRDNTYRQVYNVSNQPDSFLIPVGGIDWWYHYASGACGSADSGDTKYRDYYVVPAYGTPIGTSLIDLYAATFTGSRQEVSAGGSTLWINKLKTSSFLKTIKA